jgi:hypothetical protein
MSNDATGPRWAQSNYRQRSRSRSPTRPWNQAREQVRDRPPPQRKQHNNDRGNFAKETARINELQEEQRMKQWVSEEDTFVLKQTKKKAEIRVKERRAKPIDHLAVLLRFIETDRSPLDDEIAVEQLEIRHPEKVLAGLDQKGLQEVEEEIEVFRKLETSVANREFWETMKVICQDRMQTLKGSAPEGRIVGSVASDIDKILQPKNYDQLSALQIQVEKKLSSDEAIDFDYWGQLLKRLLIWKAKAKLKTIYEKVSEEKAKLDPTKQASSSFEAGISNGNTSRSSHKDGEAALFRSLVSRFTTTLET